uniref:receptor-like protein kinase 5 n=1 Tax=Erigeron canadensis TaxID=72917 RepID=UPI001CB9C828|nr:receptor-like protein kinase 5 [Erigeron canadensis]
MSILPPSLLILLSLLCYHATSQPIANNIQNDQNTLLKIKSFWSNPTILNHWNQSSNPCSWPEITCTTNTITRIKIENTDITGPVPPFICDIKNLTHIDLNYNYITGEFPTSLYNCKKLEYLDLSQNLLVGRIPDDISQLLPEIRDLRLFGNNFTGDIPVAISRLSKLSSLQLHQCLFNGSYPEEIGNLNDLEVLNLGFNDFTPSRLPESFTRLKKLRTFHMTEANLIGEIPGNLSGLVAIELLDLSANHLVGSIPSDLFLLKNLTEVYLYYNNLTGGIPDSIEATKLQVIDLSANKLTGKIPEGFGNLESLSNLTLMLNQLSGEVPVGIGRLPSLIDIRIFENNLSGPLPPDFGRYSDLKLFEVFQNKFTGNLPENLCYNGKLKGLIAYQNSLSGEIPNSLGSCNSLMNIQVYGNQFSGDIPDGLWKVSKLETMLINDNSFSGELPQELAPKLSTLDISNNRFSGQIPTRISSWTSLRIFRASHNRLDGVIPRNITALPVLDTLLLDGNQLSGEIPTSIVSWSSLNTLNLSRNKLTGQIPAGLGFLERLTVLDLSRNNLSGQIPSQLGRRLVVLDLSANDLSGSIPSQLDNGAFDRSFLDNPRLCSNNPSLGLNSCISRTKSGSSSKISAKNVMIIAVIAAILFLLAVLMTGYVIVLYRRRKYNLDSKWKFTSFQKLTFTESTILPRLTESNVIGHGGSGKVYRIPVNRLGDFVAVKKISTKIDLEQRLEKEFLAEVEILSTIRHSNIVKLMGCISRDNSKLLVYEYLENRSLDRWLHRKQAQSNRGLTGSIRHVVLDWPTRLQIALGAARGLSYMHHDCIPAVVHRDVKSSNVLLDGDFNAKIADFGLARILAKDSELNTMSTVAGSFGYMAPEYAHTTKVDNKIDVYSFGVILLELTTGKEASNGSEHSSLAEWAWQEALSGASISAALDDEVNEPKYLNTMSGVFKLGLWCTSRLPTNRPSMKEVCQTLLRCSLAMEEKMEKNGSDVLDHLPLLKLENV